MLIDALIREQQRAVGLLRVGLLRVLTDDDLAVEDRAGLAAENPFVDFVARAVRAGVVDLGMVVDQALAVREIEAVERDFGSFTVECGHDVVADDFPAKRKRV